MCLRTNCYCLEVEHADIDACRPEHPNGHVSLCNDCLYREKRLPAVYWRENGFYLGHCPLCHLVLS